MRASMFIAFCFLVTSIFAMKPDREYPFTPLSCNIIHKNITIITKDSVRLAGWFIPAQDSVGIVFPDETASQKKPPSEKQKPRPYPQPAGKKPTIIICDGDAGNIAQGIIIGYHFYTHGYNVFLFDWRGFGASQNWKIERDRLCWTEFLVDYDAAIDNAKTFPEVDSQRIGLWGFSTGAYLSFAMLAKRTDIKAFAGRALITSFDDLIANISKIDKDRHWLPPINYPNELIPINAAGNIKKPVFLIVGEKDIRTPPIMSKKIYEKLKGPKDLWIVPGAEHGGQKAPEMISYPEFFIKVKAFFDKYL